MSQEIPRYTYGRLQFDFRYFFKNSIYHCNSGGTNTSIRLKQSKAHRLIYIHYFVSGNLVSFNLIVSS